MRRLLRRLRLLVPFGLRLHVELVRHDLEWIEVGLGSRAEVSPVVADMIRREREQAAAALDAARRERDIALSAHADEAGAAAPLPESDEARLRVTELERRLAETLGAVATERRVLIGKLAPKLDLASWTDELLPQALAAAADAVVARRKVVAELEASIDLSHHPDVCRA